jgi:hypothetical protein
MTRLPRLLIVTALLVAPAPLVAGKGAAGLDLVNATGQTISNLYIRRTGTTSDPDCAFDPKVTLEDTTEAIWPGVNLCEVKSLTLNRNDKGVTWVDYD